METQYSTSPDENSNIMQENEIHMNYNDIIGTTLWRRLMDNSDSRIVFDEKLNIEVLTLTGMIENLPPQFHDYYELGYIEIGL